MSSSNLPAEMISEVMKYMTVEDVSDPSVSKCVFPSISVESERERRVDVVKFMGQLCSDPLELLRAMAYTGTILSGSRASEYFYPGSSCVTSDWDFFCTGSMIDLVVFVDKLRCMGATNISSFAERVEYGSLSARDRHNMGIVKALIRTGGTDFKIQVVHCPEDTPIGVLSRFDLTISQCFISGYCAFSMNSYLSRRGVCVRLSTAKDGDARDKRVSKYEARGYKMSKMCDAVRLYSLCEYTKYHPTRTRVVGDKDSHMIEFRTTPWLKDTQPRATDSYVKALQNVHWTEDVMSSSTEVDTFRTTCPGWMGSVVAMCAPKGGWAKSYIATALLDVPYMSFRVSSGRPEDVGYSFTRVYSGLFEYRDPHSDIAVVPVGDRYEAATGDRVGEILEITIATPSPEDLDKDIYLPVRRIHAVRLSLFARICVIEGCDGYNEINGTQKLVGSFVRENSSPRKWARMVLEEWE